MPNANKKKIFSILDIKYVTLETCKDDTTHSTLESRSIDSRHVWMCATIDIISTGAPRSHDSSTTEKKYNTNPRNVFMCIVFSLMLQRAHTHTTNTQQSADTPKRENDTELTLPVIKFIYLCNRCDPFSACVRVRTCMCVYLALKSSVIDLLSQNWFNTQSCLRARRKRRKAKKRSNETS